MKLLDAAKADVPAIQAIYNDAVENTTVIWTAGLGDLDTRFIWLRHRRFKQNPVRVAKAGDGRVPGYASQNA